jgi:hypothetical protein
MLKSKLRTVLFALLAVTAVAAATASTASATFVLTEIPCGSNAPNPIVFNLCYGTSEELALSEPLELTGEESITALAGENLFFVPSIPVEILCKKAEGIGANQLIKQLIVLGPNATSATVEGQLEFQECILEGTGTIASKCVIPTQEVTTALTGKAISTEAVLLKPAAGTVFIEINFTSKAGQTCPATVIGLRKVTGEEEVKVNTEDELGQKTGSSVAKSELLFIEKQAELTGEITVSMAGSKTDWFRLLES